MWTGTMRDAHRLRAHHLCALPALLFVQLWGFFLGGDNGILEKFIYCLGNKF